MYIVVSVLQSLILSAPTKIGHDVAGRSIRGGCSSFELSVRTDKPIFFFHFFFQNQALLDQNRLQDLMQNG